MPKSPTPAADILADAGRALYGENWRAPLAEAMGGHPETVRRFMSGRMTVPDAVLVKVQAAVRARIAELAVIDKRIDAARQPPNKPPRKR